jgi:AraC-like DNA-binding protein
MDISLYDNYSGVARDYELFNLDGRYQECDSMIAVICMRGTATIRIRLQDYSIKRCDFIVIGPNIPFYIAEQSDDFHIEVIRVGLSMFDFATEDYLGIHLNRLTKGCPVCTLTSRKLLMFHTIHSYLKVLAKGDDNRYRDLIVYEYLKVFFYEVCYILDHQQERSKIPKRDREITREFFLTVEKNFRNNRKVEFYAEQIGITAKHLAHVVHSVSGKYPSEWIESYLILESKKLLRKTKDSIQVISFDLNFATPSHFAKFFKDKTGMTPKEFRKMTESKYEH